MSGNFNEVIMSMNNTFRFVIISISKWIRLKYLKQNEWFWGLSPVKKISMIGLELCCGKYQFAEKRGFHKRQNAGWINNYL